MLFSLTSVSAVITELTLNTYTTTPTLLKYLPNLRNYLQYTDNVLEIFQENRVK